MKKIVFFIIIIVLIFSGVLVLKKRKEVLNSFKSVAEKKISAEYVQVKQGSLELKYKTTAQITPDETLKIISRTEGYVEFLEKEKGDNVSKGELLASLDTKIISKKISAVDAEIEKLKAEEVFFKKKYLRNKSLLKGGGVSEDTFDKSKSDYEKIIALLKKAGAEKKVLEQELEFSKIYSPVNGVILEKNANKSEFTAKGKILFEIENTKKGRYALLNIPKRFLPDLKNNKIILKQNNKIFETLLLKINPKILNNSETIQIESQRFSGREFNFPAETKVTAFFVVKKISGLKLPLNSILSLKDSYYVFKIKNNNTIEKIKVKISGMEDEYAVIDSQLLKENDRLVTGYSSFLMSLGNNMKIQPL